MCNNNSNSTDIEKAPYIPGAAYYDSFDPDSPSNSSQANWHNFICGEPKFDATDFDD